MRNEEDPNNPYPDLPTLDDTTNTGTVGTNTGPAETNTSPVEKQYSEADFQKELGGLYDPSVYQDYLRNTSYNGGSADNTDWFNRIVARNELRGTNEPNSTYTPNGRGGYTTGPTGKINYGPGKTGPAGAARTNGTPLNYPGSQFNDPYTNLLEQIAKNQINSLTGANPQRQQLTDYFNRMFSDLSTSQGYTPDEMAVLRTQALEPINAQRKASQERELLRTARAGYLPTSGITLDQQRLIDQGYDAMTTAAQRDLAINGINRQNQNRQQAIDFGMRALQLPQQQNAEALGVANGLYQLPRQAMMDALAVLQGSDPNAAIGALGGYQNQYMNNYYQNQQHNADFWASIFGSLNDIFA